MSAKIKKFLKWFLIIVLVAASVGVTVFIFFKNYNANKVKEVDLLQVVSSQKEFDENFENVYQILVVEGEAEWFKDIKETKLSLDEIMDKLTNYFVDSDFKVKDKNISDAYSSMQTTRKLLMDMFDEYEDKATSHYFPRLIGANDTYVAYSNFLTKYAKLIQAVNNNLKERNNFNVASDIKFAIIDLHARIVMDSFSKIATRNDLKIIENDDNIDAINNQISFEYSLIESGQNLSLNGIKFIQCYKNCDKNKLAKNFATTLSIASIAAGSTNEQKAAYYFDQIF